MAHLEVCHMQGIFCRTSTNNVANMSSLDLTSRVSALLGTLSRPELCCHLFCWWSPTARLWLMDELPSHSEISERRRCFFLAEGTTPGWLSIRSKVCEELWLLSCLRAELPKTFSLAPLDIQLKVSTDFLICMLPLHRKSTYCPLNCFSTFVPGWWKAGQFTISPVIGSSTG